MTGSHCEEAYADEAISERPEVKIAAPACGWLAMTSRALATILSYARQSPWGKNNPLVVDNHDMLCG